MKVIQGDLLDMFDKGEFDVIAHGANCFNLMGAGIAHSIATRYPLTRQADFMTTKGDPNKLGSWSETMIPRAETALAGIVYNFYTQYEPGANFDVEAFTLILRKFKLMTQRRGWENVTFGIPFIGCGIGGGNPLDVMAVVDRELVGIDVTMVEFSESPAPLLQALFPGPLNL